MKMHTAQHLMSGLAYENFNATRTVGNQIHATHSRIDFNPISFTEEMLETLANKANELTKQSIIVDDGIMTRDEINSIMPPDRTNMNLLPKSVRNLRVVKIGDDVDLCPCAGTHVANLIEIGSVNIIGKKSKGKGTQRITYELSPSNNILQPDSRII